MAVIMCCKECVAPKRHPGCHGTCEEYLAEKARYEILKADYNQQKKIYSDIYSQRANRVEKALKRRGSYRGRKLF